MYTLVRENLQPPGATTLRAPALRARVSGTVILIGLTSLLTDISSEMVASILPLYLVLQLQLSPLYFGLIDGLYQLASVPLRLAGGFVADRWDRHKEVAASGYGLSAFCKLGLLSAGSVWPGITGFLLLDRAGKGIRTAPRDAMISANSTSDALGTSFGVHRAMDTLGALLGPVIAFLILTKAPEAFDSIFVVSFCFALVGVSVLVLFVDGARARGKRVDTQASALDVPAAQDAPAEPAVNLKRAALLLARPQFRRIMLIASGLALFTVSDGFLYLVLQRRLDFDAGFFPLLYVGTAVAYFALAIPVGWLADRFGRGRVLVIGYLFLIGTYTALLREPVGPAEIVVYLAIFGAYYAATDGVLAAMTSAALPDAMRATGLAMVASTTGLFRFGGAILFGAVWAAYGSQAALFAVLAGIAAMTIVAALTIGRDEGVPDAA